MNKIVSLTLRNLCQIILTIWAAGVKVTFYIFLCLFSTFALAGTEGVMPSNFRYLMDLSYGTAWIIGSRQNPDTFNRNTDLEATFLHHGGSNSPVFNGELFLGVQKTVTPNLIGQLGLVVGETSVLAVNGSIWSGIDSSLHNATPY